MTWWKVLYFAIGILTLISGVRDTTWYVILIGIFFLYLGVIAK